MYFPLLLLIPVYCFVFFFKCSLYIIILSGHQPVVLNTYHLFAAEHITNNIIFFPPMYMNGNVKENFQ